jgi:IMP dehydrogenase/GMP reductase
MAKTSGGLRGGNKSAVGNTNTVKAESANTQSSERPLTTQEKNQAYFAENAKRRDLKTAPKDYKEGNYSVETKNFNNYKDNVEKLADIKANSTASVRYTSSGQLTEVRRDGNLYTVTKKAFKKDGSLSVNRRDIFSKSDFEKGDLRDIL